MGGAKEIRSVLVWGRCLVAPCMGCAALSCHKSFEAAVQASSMAGGSGGQGGGRCKGGAAGEFECHGLSPVGRYLQNQN